MGSDAVLGSPPEFMLIDDGFYRCDAEKQRRIGLVMSDIPYYRPATIKIAGRCD